MQCAECSRGRIAPDACQDSKDESTKKCKELEWFRACAGLCGLSGALVCFKPRRETVCWMGLENLARRDHYWGNKTDTEDSLLAKSIFKWASNTV